MQLLTKAIAYASKKHERQKRKGTNIPYIAHPLEALSIAATITNDEKVLAAAVLHDVVEDCGVSIRQIEAKFGKEVARLVAADTEDKMTKKSSEDTWKIRKQETLNCIEKMDKNSKIVVLADKLSNMRAIYRDYEEKGDMLWQKFNCKSKDEQGWYYEGVRRLIEKDLSDTAAYLEFSRLNKIVFGCSKWYEVLIREEFIDYFSDENNKFYFVVDGEEIKEPLFENFGYVISGIVAASFAATAKRIDRYFHDEFYYMHPYFYFGYRAAYEGFVHEQKDLNKVLELEPGSSITSLYKLDPMSLSADKIAKLLMYPFWSRMGGSYEINFLKSGNLKKYLLALKKKHMDEMGESEGKV